MNLFAKLSLDASGFNGPLAGARGALSSFTSGLTGIVAPMLTVQAAIGGFRELFSQVRDAIGEGAQMEDFETVFTGLLGSTKEAKSRLAELAQFAQTTPFELRDVVQSSRLLQVFGGAALSTGEGLRMVGDAAATAGRPLRDVDLWMGRLFLSLKEGLPLGEPIQNLTQLGLITGDVRRQLLALQGTQLSEAEVMRTLTGIYAGNAGAMDRLSKTLTGRISNLKDAWSAVKREFGAPIVDALKPFVMEITQLLEQLRPIARKAGEAVAIVMQAFAGGHLGELAGLSLKLGFQESVNFLWQKLVTVFSAVRTLLTNPDFWSGVAAAVLGSFKGLPGLLGGGKSGAPAEQTTLQKANDVAGAVLDLITFGLLGKAAKEAGEWNRSRKGAPADHAAPAPGNSAPGAALGGVSAGVNLGGFSFGGASDILDFSQLQFGRAAPQIGDLVRDAWQSAVDATGDTELFDTTALRDKWSELIDGIKGELAALKSDVELEKPKSADADANGVKKKGGKIDEESDRLARIGGLLGAGNGPAAIMERAGRDLVTAGTELRGAARAMQFFGRSFRREEGAADTTPNKQIVPTPLRDLPLPTPIRIRPDTEPSKHGALRDLGSFIGPAGGPGLDYARRTADNTAKTEKAMLESVAALQRLIAVFDTA